MHGFGVWVVIWAGFFFWVSCVRGAFAWCWGCLCASVRGFYEPGAREWSRWHGNE